MIESAKISAVHQQRLAVVYVRQSSPGQLERNRESTMRQYNFVARAVALGWAEAQVIVIDEDQGISASGLFDRAGFAQLTAEVALAHVGIVLGVELSRLSRNNADWYRLLDLCGLTGTLLADEDGIYDPGHRYRLRQPTGYRSAHTGRADDTNRHCCGKVERAPPPARCRREPKRPPR